MKKIIYSLVIMIAAGSLFTSCIEPIEPAGIYDLREAKARYYDALSKLRAADAMLVEASAAYEQQRAEFEKKLVENQELLNQAQKLANEAQALGNEQEAFRWEQEKERLETERELLKYQWEQQFLQAQLDLREAVARFDMAMLDLTDAEKQALAKAIADYEDAYQEWIWAQQAVTSAEAALWEAQYAFENQTDKAAIYYDKDYGWNTYINTGEDLISYYKSCVETYEEWAEYYADLKEYFENNTELADWAAELETLKAAREALLYSRNEVTVDSVYFMEGVFHEANIAMGIAVDEWIENNPGVKNPGDAPVEPKESDYPAANYQKDSIAFPVFEYKTPNKAYDKFVSLLVGPAGGENYAKVKTIVGDSTNVILVQDATKKTLTLVANNQMKDFVLGFEEPKSDSLSWTYYDKKEKKTVEVKAKWGLLGALTVLNRDGVLDEDAPEEVTPEQVEAARKQWNSDRDSILLLYQAKKDKKSVAEAYAPLKKALDDLKKATEDNTTGNGSLAKATEDLVAILNGIIPHTDLSVPDSNAIINAIADFATKREAYLNYKFDKKSAIDSNYFHFVRSTSPAVSYDSIEFKKLSMAVLLDSNYGPFFPYTRIAADPYWAKNANGTKAPGLQNIIEEFMGGGIAAKIEAGTGKVTETDLNSVAFYNTFKYVAKSGTEPSKIVYLDGSAYTPKAVTDAIAVVKREVAALNALWDRFWKEDLGATADDAGKVTIPTLDDKYNPATYTADAFLKPYNVVIFDGANIIWTEAIGDVLASLDPKRDASDNKGTNFNASGYVSGAAIFEGTNGKTDFYTYMLKLAQSKKTSSTDLAEITKWVNDVVAAFDKDAKDAEAAAKKAFEDAKDAYAKKAPAYKEAKDKYDAYYKALKEFVGTKTVDGKEVLLNVKTVDGVQVPSLKELPKPADYQTPYVKQTQKEPFVWEGEWNKERIGGKQLEIANELFVDEEGTTYPELLASWRSQAKWINDQVNHIEKAIDVIEKAYMAAISSIYDVSGNVIEFFFDSEEGYLESILEELNDLYEESLAYASIIERIIEKAKAGYDPMQLNIMLLEDKLAVAQQKLVDAEAKLAAAQAYYEKVLNAILGAN